jgi:Mg2+ and Co2+ transporter CorA
MRCRRATQGPVKALYKLEDDADKAEQKLLAAQKRKEEIPKMMQCVKRPVSVRVLLLDPAVRKPHGLAAWAAGWRRRTLTTRR